MATRKKNQKVVKKAAVKKYARKNSRRYLVGYYGKAQDAVYSNDGWAYSGEGGVCLMTLTEAKQYLPMALASVGVRAAIFEVLPVEVTML